MRILMIASVAWPPIDGIGRHIEILAGELGRRGHDVTVMTRGRARAAEEIRTGVLRVLKIPYLPLYPMHVHLHGLFIDRAIRSLAPRPDVIHLHSPLVAPVRAFRPLVTTLHSPSFLTFEFAAPWDGADQLRRWMGRTVSSRIEKKLLRISDEAIVVHESVREGFCRHYGGRRDFHVIPNAVDTDFFRPDPEARPSRVLLYSGRLDFRKGLREIVASAPAVIARFPDVRYVLMGDGPMRIRLERDIERMGLSEHFSFPGNLRESEAVRTQYRRAFAVLHPSYAEAHPLAVLEAMACGKPVIAAAAGYEEGLVRDGADALLVPPRSAESLGAAILRLLSDPELAARLGREARRRAEAAAGIRAVTERIEAVYASACSKIPSAGAGS